jgi:hypothetical protein
MRILLVICCIIAVSSVYSQTKPDSLVDSLPVLKINKKELVNTPTNYATERRQDSFPRKIVQETYYKGRIIRVITEYTSP